MLRILHTACGDGNDKWQRVMEDRTLGDTAEKPTSGPADRWLWPAIVLLIIVAPSQFSYALHPKHGPFILYADVLAGALFVWWAITVLARGRSPFGKATGDKWRESGGSLTPGPSPSQRRLGRGGNGSDKIILPPTAIWALLGVAVLSAAGATSLKSAAVEIAQLALYFVAVFSMFANMLRSQHRLGVAVKALGFATTIVVAWGV